MRTDEEIEELRLKKLCYLNKDSRWADDTFFVSHWNALKYIQSLPLEEREVKARKDYDYCQSRLKEMKEAEENPELRKPGHDFLWNHLSGRISFYWWFLYYYNGNWYRSYDTP